MAEILDVITRLTYEAQTAGLDKAYEAIEKQINGINQQAESIIRLEALRAKTDKTDINRQNQITVALENRRKKIADLTREIGKEAQANDKLKVSLLNQFGAYNMLVNKQGQLTKSTNQASSAVLDFSRIIQDAPYGIQGVANNIDQAVVSFGRLFTSAGSAKEAFKQLGSSLIGGAGIGLAISIVTALLVKFGDQLFATSKAADKATESYQKFTEAVKSNVNLSLSSIDEQVGRLRILRAIINDTTASELQRKKAIEEVQTLFPGTTKEAILQGDIFKSLERQVAAKEKSNLASKTSVQLSEQERNLKTQQEESQKRLNNAQAFYDASRLAAQQASGKNQDIAIRQSQKALETLKEARKQYEGIGVQLKNVRNAQGIANQQAASLAIDAGTSFFGNDKPDAPKKQKTVKDIILPNADEDINDLAQDIERIRILAKTLNDILLENTINNLPSNDAFRKYAESTKRTLSGFEAEIITGIGPKTSDAEAQSIFDSIRDKQIENQTKIENLKKKIREASYREELTEEEKLQRQLLDIRIQNTLDITRSFDTVVTAAGQAAAQLVAIEQERNDRFIEIQTDRVEQAKYLAERGNTEILRLEQERLNEAQLTRERLAERQLKINALIQASNQAVALTEAIGAVVKAAAEGDPYTIAFRVASAVAALIAGVAAIQGAFSSDEGFKKGGYTGDGNPSEAAGPVHRREFVFNERLTGKYRPLFEAIHKTGEIPLAYTASMQPNGGFASKKELKTLGDRIVGAIEDNHISMNQKMDRDGVAQSVESVIRKQKRLWG